VKLQLHLWLVSDLVPDYYCSGRSNTPLSKDRRLIRVFRPTCSDSQSAGRLLVKER
jgi:hypothetical protein